MLGNLLNVLRIPELRKKVMITFGFIIVYRIGIYLPLPGVSYDNVRKFGEEVAKAQGDGTGNQLMTLFNLFSGGSIQNVALFALGIMPYISASIIMQLLTKMWPTLEALSKEGQSGQDKINSYTRYLTVFLCMIQGYMIIQTVVYREWGLPGGSGVIYFVEPAMQTALFTMKSLIALTAGTMFLMWVGDQITEHGIGQGASLIIMLGIIGNIPMIGSMLYAQVKKNEMSIGQPLVLLVCYVFMVAAVVFITQGQRRLPIQYAKHTRGRRVYGMSQRTHFPIRVNMAGVMPVIFASSLMIFPGMIFQNVPWAPVQKLSSLFGPVAWTYLTIYISAVFFFSYFWNALMFNPIEQADRMKEIGAFIPGFTPGKKTGEYFEKVMNRITLAGAAFLAAIAIAPNIATLLMGMDFSLTQILGGTGLLIVAGVALDVITKIESHLVMRNYDGFLKGGRVRGRR